MKTKISVSVVSMLTAFVLAEVCLRVFRPVGSEMQPLYLPDEQIGWVLAPNQRGFVRQRNYAVPYLINSKLQTNSLGMRDREYSVQKGDKPRILVLGDSFTEGWGVEQDQAFPKVLENEFLENVEVWNMGVVGYSTDQEFYQLRRVIGESRPDIVILGFYENDIGDNTRGKTPWFPHMIKPLFVLQGSEPVVSNAPSLHQQWAQYQSASASLYGRMRSILLQSAVVRLTRFTVLKLTYKGRVKKQGTDDLLDTWVRLNSYRVAESGDMRNGWRLTERFLVEMNDLCKEHEARFLMLYIPRALEVIRGELERQQQQVGLAEPASAFDLDLPEHKLRDIAQRNGLPLIPMHGVFRSLAHPEQLYLAPDKDGHLSPQGQLLLARTLATYLCEKGWLPPADFRASALLGR